VNCVRCKTPILKERLEALPNTKVCMACAQATVGKRVGFMDYGHKTAPSLVQIESNDKEGIRLAKRAFRRAR